LLSLDDTAVTDAGLKELKALVNLEYLSVCSTNVTAEGVMALHEALPDCEIDSLPERNEDP
jgi:hypothetical protein